MGDGEDACSGEEEEEEEEMRRERESREGELSL